MADDFISPLLQYINGSQGIQGANAAQLEAYKAILKNLNDRFGDYSKLGPAGYQDIQAQHLGPSELSKIQNDAAARGAEQDAIASYDDIARRGGLNLSDMAALNKIQQNLGRNNAARQNSLSNQYAARGQLGSGAQLAMELAGNQSAAMTANEAGESRAAQAQQRAMQAIAAKAQAARGMASDDYAHKSDAARAADAIAAHNASMATDASKYNNTLKGQTYDDYLKKLQGENQVTGQLNTALLGQGGTRADGITAQTNANDKLIGAGSGIVNGLVSKLGSGGSGGGSANDPGLDSGGVADSTGNRGGSGDLSGGGSLASEDNGAGFGDYGGSSPDEWETPDFGGE